MPAISVIMPCHNRGYELTRILSAYERQELNVPFEIIAIDDGSIDNTFEILSSFQPQRFLLRTVRLPVCQGPAAARNMGIAIAKSPIILFVGDDIVPAPNLLNAHLYFHKIRPEPEIAVLGHIEWDPAIPQNTLMKHIDGIGAQQFSYYFMKSGQEYDFRHFYTANISLKRDFLLQLDRWFDTTFPYAAFEDIELAYRLTRLGLRIVYVGDCIAYHSHYHTVWSFSERQYRTGMMAWHLIKKHPLTARWLIRKEHKKAFVWYLGSQFVRGKRTFGEMLDIESNLLHFLSFYEWLPCALLDVLYLKVLDYFYFKGFISGILGNSPYIPELAGAYVDLYLIPAIHWFLKEARLKKVPIPFGEEVLKWQ